MDAPTPLAWEQCSALIQRIALGRIPTPALGAIHSARVLALDRPEANKVRPLFPWCVAVGLDEFFLESGDIVGVGVLKVGCREGGYGEKLGEAIKGFLLGGHADSPVDNPQGGADIVVA